MSSSDFDPTNIDSGSEVEIPKKRVHVESNSSILPNPLDLLNEYKSLEKQVPKEKPIKKAFSCTATIFKTAILKKHESDDLEQYDYFANQSTAILQNWKSPQEIPDPHQGIDRKKLIKKIDMRRKKPDDIATKLERELKRREEAKSGWKRWKKDEEVKMKQQYDS